MINIHYIQVYISSSMMGLWSGTSVKVGVFWGVPKAGLKQLMVRVRRVPAIEERAGKSGRARGFSLRVLR